MEGIKHTEWTLGLVFWIYFLSRNTIESYQILAIIVGSQFPDVLEMALDKLNSFSDKNRSWTHNPLNGITLLALGLLFYPIAIIGIAFLLHLFEDLFAGGKPIFLLGPLSHRGGFQIISPKRASSIGKVIDRRMGHFVIVSGETTSPILGWFWLIQFSAIIFGIFGFFFYIRFL